jgi:MFS family permease
MEPRFFIKRVPQSLSTVLGAGLIVGSFYGLAPLYASQQGLSTEQVGLFMGSCIFAGLVVQWPLGWLSDRYDRALLIRCFAGFLAVAALPLAICRRCRWRCCSWSASCVRWCSSACIRWRWRFPTTMSKAIAGCR